jgi:hypothetical protein
MHHTEVGAEATEVGAVATEAMEVTAEWDTAAGAEAMGEAETRGWATVNLAEPSEVGGAAEVGLDTEATLTEGGQYIYSTFCFCKQAHYVFDVCIPEYDICLHTDTVNMVI